MINRLYIKNLAIIEEVELRLPPGLVVITGETGTGKSILVGAIDLLLGGRASADMVRTGEDTAVIEGDIRDRSRIRVIRRVIRRGGASRIFLDDEPIKQADLRETTRNMVDLHGQHEHQSLLRVPTHLEFLDAYAGVQEELSALAETYRDLTRCHAQLHRIEKAHLQEENKHEHQLAQLRELEAAVLVEGEEASLSDEYKLLSQAEELHATLRTIVGRLKLEEGAVVEELGTALKQLQQYTEFSPELQRSGERLQSLRLELQDVAEELEGFDSRIRADPARSAEVGERIQQLETIKRKYGGTVANALATQAELRAAAALYDASNAEAAALRRDLQRYQALYAEQCGELSERRQGACVTLEQAIVGALAELDMPETRFQVRMKQAPSDNGLYSRDGKAYWGDDKGIDQVEFYLSPNPGEDLRPLAKIASGGEVSRIMLGIKTVLADFDPVGCLIFDEIDSGISGATADIVGRALAKLASSRQVLCITHLPQIAARGSHHIVLTKRVIGERTFTSAEAASGVKRELEVARLLSGATITSASRNQARILLAKSEGDDKNMPAALGVEKHG